MGNAETMKRGPYRRLTSRCCPEQPPEYAIRYHGTNVSKKWLARHPKLAAEMAARSPMLARRLRFA